MPEHQPSREAHDSSDDVVLSLLPPHTREMLYDPTSKVTWHLPGPDDEQCEGAEYHSPRPLAVIDTTLVRRDWWPEDHPHAVWASAPRAYLCGTCATNVDILLQMLHATDGMLDWRVRREFGNKIRALAATGWVWYVSHATPPPKGS